jgi:MFS family permease
VLRRLPLKDNRLIYEPDVREVVRSRALLNEGKFFALWLSQGVSQTAQNALLFTLLVVVLAITNSSIHTSFLILSFILPSIPLGFAVGVILDRVNKGPILILTNVVRAALCMLLFFFHDNEWIIYAISAGIASASLFFNPAVVALIPSVVRKERLVQANSLYNFTLTGAQLIGIVFLAPTVLKIKGLGADGMFLIATAMFGVAAIAAARLSLEPEQKQSRPASPGQMLGGIPTEFRESWRALTADRRSVLALAQLIISSTLVLLFAILIPRYMRDVIDVPADSAALVFAPTGIGALIGLRFIPVFAKKGKNRVVVIGLAGIAVCLVLLALVNPIAELWESAPASVDPSRFLRVSLLQALVMCFAGPMGFFYALLNAPAQTVLHERAPPEMRGRIFATQVVSANFISLVPLLAIGAITDLLNVTVVLLLLAAIVGGTAAISRWMDEKEAREAAEERVPEGVGT